MPGNHTECPIYVRDCRTCDGTFTGRHVDVRYCSARCSWLARRQYRIYVRDCEWCGRPHTFRRKLGRFCSSECRTAFADANPDRNRRKNQKRKNHRAGVYSMAEVAERDGGRCHLCRKRVDMTLSGNDRMGPTIDHLIPVSAGGDDVITNVRLAHRSCNCSRGARGDVQLLLVG